MDYSQLDVLTFAAIDPAPFYDAARNAAQPQDAIKSALSNSAFSITDTRVIKELLAILNKTSPLKLPRLVRTSEIDCRGLIYEPKTGDLYFLNTDIVCYCKTTVPLPEVLPTDITSAGRLNKNDFKRFR